MHAGYDTSFGAENPNRLVPLDALRKLESDHDVGPLFGEMFVTTGNNTSVAMAVTFGREMAEELRSAGVAAAVFTST